MGARLVWLGLTPEPERELPIAVATLRSRSTDDDLAALIDAETCRIDRLILRGTERTWLRYLHEVTVLIAAAATTDPGSRGAEPTATLVLPAAEAVLAHHQMLIGLPGNGYERVAADRAALTTIVTRLREVAG